MRDVTIDIRSAKNDEGRQGHRFTCTQVDLVTSTSLFDFSQESWDFACLAGPVRGTAFLTWQVRLRLTYGQFNKMLKQVSPGVGLDPDVISAHWLRFPGASALANRAVPDHVIQSVGRWKSLTFLAYTRLARRAYNDAVEKLCDLGSLTIEDVRRMMPGMKRA